MDFRELAYGRRFDRQESLPAWSQRDLSRARVLVVGAGAVGNELLKNLALLGVGTLGIIDFDVVEESNLSRCVLFGACDLGRPKAAVAAEKLRSLYEEIRVEALVADLMSEVGAGFLEEFDLLLGAVDSAAARWQLNRLSRRAGLRWIDAGVDAGCGQVSVFDPKAGACYECGLTDAMWAEIQRRRSCTAGGERAVERLPLAVALPVVALTAALQAQEAVGFLMNSACGSGLAPGQRMSVSLRPYDLVVLEARQRRSCLAHGEDLRPARPVAVGTECNADDLLKGAAGERLELSWEVIYALTCPTCGSYDAAIPTWRLRVTDLPCPGCGRDRRPEQTSVISSGDELARRTLAELGVPAKAHVQVKERVGGEWIWCRLL